MIALLLPLLFVQSAAERRMQAVESDFKPVVIVIPRANFSDESTDASAAHFCGTSDVCKANFRGSRDKLVAAYAGASKGGKRGILKLIDEDRQGSLVNWSSSFTRYDAKQGARQADRDQFRWLYRRGIRSTVRCTSSVSGKTYTSTCTSSTY